MKVKIHSSVVKDIVLISGLRKNERSFSFIAKHLNPSLRQEEHITAKECLYTISRKIHIIRFWIDMDSILNKVF